MTECKNCGLNTDNASGLCTKCSEELPGVGFTQFKIELKEDYFRKNDEAVPTMFIKNDKYEYNEVKLDRPYFMGYSEDGTPIWSHYDPDFHYDLNKLKDDK